MAQGDLSQRPLRPVRPVRFLSVEECRLWRKENSSRSNWKRQVTFQTPLQRLPWFTRELLAHLTPIRAALLMVDTNVFSEPAELVALRRAAGEARSWREAPGMLFEEDADGLAAGLTAALRGWCDFRLLCAPSNHAIRADHDGYTTFFSTSPGRIATLRQAMRIGGVHEAEWTARDP